MMVYAGPWPDGVKQPVFSQCEYHLPSNWLGSKLLSMTGGKQMLVFSKK
jgi:hypothetical protein